MCVSVCVWEKERDGRVGGGQRERGMRIFESEKLVKFFPLVHFRGARDLEPLQFSLPLYLFSYSIQLETKPSCPFSLTLTTLEIE